ncbi:MAG: hypothetical protein IKJ55_02600, partial [Clostridia bacterium]|nr:hypothetical protein [Clostridia bacterium]
YIKEFEATVLSCEKEKDLYKIVLDKTAFFPEGGGQTSDVGKISDAVVTDVQEQDDIIYHYANKEVQGVVSCTLDFEKRFDKMQNHSGEHLVSGLSHKLFGTENVGFHLADDVVTLDTNIPLTGEQIVQLELEANKAIYANVEIKCFFPSAEELETLVYRSKLDLKENVRIVDITGIDACACCAPHVKQTGEIGIIKVIDSMNWKGGTRLTILCGERALSHYKKTYETVKAISNLFSAKQDTLFEFVSKYAEETEKLKNELAGADIERAKLIASLTPETDQSIVIKDDCLKNDGMRELVNLLKDKTEKCVCVLSGVDGAYRYILGAKEMPLRTLIKDLNQKLNGKGGGNDQMVQGTFNAPFNEIETEIKNL